MPAILDRCVKEVRKQMITKGLSFEEAERRAFAICRSRLKMESNYDFVEEFKNDLVKVVNTTIKEKD